MDIKRINLEDFDDDRYPGGWVDVKEKRPYSAARKIESAALRVVPQSGSDFDNLSTSTVEFAVDNLAQGLAVLEWHVVAWSLTDDEGVAIQPNVSGFMHEDFDDDLGEWLTAQIDTIVDSRRRSKSRLAESRPVTGRDDEPPEQGSATGISALRDSRPLAGSVTGTGS